MAAARAHGIAVLITDHHLGGCAAARGERHRQPESRGSRFGSRALAGVGVAFYVMAALKRRLDESGGAPGSFAVATLLDLVALGTVADVVPLDVNNRVLIAQGLKRIRAGRCVAGIPALLQLSGRSSRELTAADLAFGVAPRLNAAGRIDDMSIGIQCLLRRWTRAGARRAPRYTQRGARGIEAKIQQEALAAVPVPRRASPRPWRATASVLLHRAGPRASLRSSASTSSKRPAPTGNRLRASPMPQRSTTQHASISRLPHPRHLRCRRSPPTCSSSAASTGTHAPWRSGLTLETHARALYTRVDQEVQHSIARLSCRRCGSGPMSPLAVAEIGLATAQALRARVPWGQHLPRSRASMTSSASRPRPHS